MSEQNKQENQKSQQPQGGQKSPNDAVLLDLLKRCTGVYNHVIQGKLLDANDIQKINNVFLSMVVLNERNYFENAIRKKEIDREKLENYLQMRHKFILKQMELLLQDLSKKIMESRDNKAQASE